MSETVYAVVTDLKGFSPKNCVFMPDPIRVITCPPDHYQEAEESSPFAAGLAGRIDRRLALKQWQDLRDVLVACGMKVEIIPAVAGLSDMVFCSNQAFAGLNPRNERVCLLGSMRNPSRRREVAACEAWFRESGYRVSSLKDKNAVFEGAGDAVWHPGKRLIWGGFGFHSDAAAYDEVARFFSAPVVVLKLVNEKFPHLDSCFCPLTSESVLIYPSAFDSRSLELIFRLFPVIITASEPEAMRQMACNAVVIGGKTVILQRGAGSVARHLIALGLEVVEVDVSEFIKGGGGARSLKMFVY